MERKLIIILFFIAIVLLFSFLYFAKLKTVKFQNQNFQKETDICESYQDADEKANCLAILKEDISYCEKIQSQEAKDNCYLNLFLLKQNISYCDKIQDENQRNFCKNLKNDVSSCAKLNGSEKEMCYTLFSILNNDKNLCLKLEENREKCESIIIPEEMKILAKKREEIIKGETLLRDKGVSENNVTLCRQIENTNLRDNCFWQLAKQNNNLDFCNEILQENEKLSCLATLKKDFLLCDKNNNIEDKDYCYLSFVVNSKIEDGGTINKICQKISKGDIKDDCYMQGAIHLENTSLCEEIKDSSSSDLCKTILKKDKNLCHNLNNPFYKDYCLYYVAELLKDKSICSEITDEFMSQKCNRKFQ